uniref:RNA binding motif protein 34 n=1 Tax=Oryzias sinensis TaxID=183150 RepID=A0A8C7YWW5_9TELE
MKENMKKKDSSSELQSSDYVVGQVSGSLFQQNSAASGSLSVLFSTAATSSSLLFQPAPKVHDIPSKLTLGAPITSFFLKELKKPQEKQKKKKPPRESSVAEQKVENRYADSSPFLFCSYKNCKRKVLELDREQDAEYWVLKRQKMKARKQEEATKTKRTVFVGNLPVTCTKKVLLQNIIKPVSSMRFLFFLPSRRQVHPQRKSMNAYVVFKEEESDEKCSVPQHDHKRSVFVGNLPFDIQEQAFRKHFETCGTVEAVRLVRDKDSGLGKGFGYVLFESADSVQLALELNASKLEGRSIRVKRSVKKEKQKNQTGGKETAKKPAKNKRSWQDKSPGRFKSSKKVFGNQQKSEKKSTSFKGEMVDPSKKPKKRGLKKKGKAKKRVHI